MLKHSAYLRSVLRLIINNPARFLAILIISALGLGFFSGIRATSPDKKATLDKYFNETSMYDARVLSGTGFSDEDISQLRETLPRKISVFPAYSAEVFAAAEGRSLLVTLKSFEAGSEINLPVLTEGRLPLAANECIVDDKFRNAAGFKIGTIVTFSEDGGQNAFDMLSDIEFTIVGFVKSPIYISNDRGTSAKSGWQISGFAYVPAESFAFPVYNEVYLRFDKPGVSRFSDEYTGLLEDMSREIAGLGWYFIPLTQNTGFVSYEQDCDRIAAVAVAVPIIFFLVAALVTLTQMTRIAEDDRGDIGVQKSLGYSSGAIIFKYIFYAFLASAAGGIIGLSIGLRVFPLVIYRAYGVLYNTPALILAVKIRDCLPEYAVSVLCAVIPAALVSCAEALGKPAALMRPKAPIAGKRILLERVTPLWKHMKFSYKVTARNLFRFKKRLYMTIAGIAGCTALMLTGFGLYDSIMAILDIQFGSVLKYDFQAMFKRNPSQAELDGIYASLGGIDEIADYVVFGSRVADVFLSGEDAVVKDVYLTSFTPGTEKYISLRDRKSQTALTIDDSGVIISEKLSVLLNVRPGDVILVSTGDNAKDITVAGITENYAMHYIYISPVLYAQVFGEPPPENIIAGTVKSASDETEAAVIETLLSHQAVGSVSFNQNIRNSYTKSLKALNAIVYVLIATSAALAFVVLFSLYGISIDERERELATIKVLGFNDRETEMYIYRENIILTLFGIAAGLFLGVPLHNFVIKTCELDFLMFARKIEPVSFAWSALLAILFSIIVNLLMNRRVKRIDMVGALKSVE